MAELLVKAVSANHSDPAIDSRDCYKRGDVVGVAPDGWPWGAKELKPPVDGGKFVVIKITDVTRQQVLAWVRNHWGCEIDGIDWINDPSNIVRRRRVRIDVDLVPNSVKQTLNQTGQYSTTWAQIRQYIHNKLTDTAASGSING